MSITNWGKSLIVGVCIGTMTMLVVGVVSQSDREYSLSAEAANQSLASSSSTTAVCSDSSKQSNPQPVILRSSTSSLPDSYVSLCQGLVESDAFQYPAASNEIMYGTVDGPTYGIVDDPTYDMVEGTNASSVVSQPTRLMRGIDENTRHILREPRWRSGKNVPWEQFAYGEYIGPHRTPHLDEYRVRIGDQLECNFLQTRHRLPQKYQLNIGDLIQISSAVDTTLTQPANIGNGINGLQIMPDGSVSLALIGQVQAAGKTVEDLQQELNEKYLKYVKNPSIIVQVTKSGTPVDDLLVAVTSRFGQGGPTRLVTVAPDGTIQLPLIGSVPAIGLTLAEMGREINARYRERIQGVEVTPILLQRAPRFVYVLGEVKSAGRFELTAPTSAMQAVALAGGFDRRAGNLRQIIVFRRDQNWQLVATKLDLSGALYGKSPRPADEIWLRDSDIVLVPAKPIQRLSDAVNLYLSNTVYAIFPQQGIAFNFDNFRTL